MLASEVREVFHRLGMRADKGLGQHFLVDDRIARRQVELAAIDPEDTVLEIGPGLGVLTRLLMEKTKNVIVVEKDRRFCRFLKDQIEEVEVIQGDALEVELPRFDVTVSNLPYQISSPITFRLLEAGFSRAVLMFQKEFAKRMVAGKGDADYSRLSVNVYYRANAKILEHVSRKAFYPQPEVDSSIVYLKPRKPPFRVGDEDFYFRVVNRLFQHRRKTIDNSLLLSWQEFGKSRQGVKNIVASAGFSGKRVEELEPEAIGILANALLAAR